MSGIAETLPGEIIASKVIKVIRENKQVTSLYLKPLKQIPEPIPGQFFMVWVPEFEEIPISVSGYFDGVVRLSIAAIGETTRALQNYEVGNVLGLKGPLGRGIPLKKATYLLISGGYGAAPLAFAARKLVEIGARVLFATGARTKDFLLFHKEVAELGAEVFVATDDGSEGHRGTVIDVVLEHNLLEEAEVVVTCGPEGLLKSASKLALRHGKEAYVLAERYMKCGIGLCGSCVLGNSGLLVCKDGPVFKAEAYLRALGEID